MALITHRRTHTNLLINQVATDSPIRTKVAKAKADKAKARGQPSALPNAKKQKLDNPCGRCGNPYHMAKVCNAGWMYNRKGDAAAKLPIETSAYAKAGKEGWTGTKYP
jgi:hypothetical protein